MATSPLPDQIRVSQALLIDSNLFPFDTSGASKQICIPERLLVPVVGLLLTMTRLDVYDYGINYDERDERIQFIYGLIASIGDCMNCSDVIQCLTSSTEYSVVARYTLDQYKAQWESQNTALYGGYNGTPQSIVSTVSNTVSTSSQDSINRLCQAVEYWLTEYREKKRTELAYALYGTMALAGIALAITAATFGAFTLIGGIVIGATVIAGVTLSEALAAIENDTYFENVKCALVNAAHQGTLTWANFDAWLIEGKVNLFGELAENDCAGDFGSFASFVQWLDYMQNAVSPTFEVDCDCISLIPFTGYFDWHNHAPEEYEGITVSFVWGGYSPGNGLYTLQNPDGSGNNFYGLQYQIILDTPINIDSIVEQLNGMMSGSITLRRMWLYDSSDTLIRYISTGTSLGIPTITWNETGNWAGVKKIILLWKVYNSPNLYEYNLTITEG